MSVNVFSTKVLIGDTIFTSPNEDGTAILRGHPSHAKVSPLAVQRKYLHFSVILRPWVMVRPRESNPRPPALQSNALPTELIFLKEFCWSGILSNLLFQIEFCGSFGIANVKVTICRWLLMSLYAAVCRTTFLNSFRLFIKSLTLDGNFPCCYVVFCRTRPKFSLSHFVMPAHIRQNRYHTGAPNENIVPNHLNIALLNVF